jgi:hypothetical protein
MKLNLHPNYITGLIDGEGSFNITISRDENRTTGHRVVCEIHVTQKAHSASVLYLLKEYFGCGIIKPKRANNELKTAQNVRSVSRYVVSNLSDVMNVIIPFFDDHPLFTSKSLDYGDWKTLIKMKVSKEHLTEVGIQKMFQIKSQMNRGRKGF